MEYKNVMYGSSRHIIPYVPLVVKRTTNEEADITN